MSIKSEFKKVLRFFNKKENPEIAKKEHLYFNANITTDEEIGNYKRNAWNSSEAADRYYKNVEHNFFNAVTSKFYTNYLKLTDKVLDVGAGTGRLSFAIADIGCEVVSTDISESMLNVIEKTKGERKISTIVSDGDGIPVGDEQFDAVVSMDFMLHFHNWQDFLKEKVRACKRGGHIIYNFYSGDNLNNINKDKAIASNYIANGEFIAHCTQDELKIICEELGLEIIKLQPYNFLAGNGLWFPNLTTEEVVTLRNLYTKIMTNEKILHVIKEFEEKVVENLTPEYCATMVIVLRKK